MDAAATNSPLDRTTEAILADVGLAGKISLSQIKDGAEAANGLNQRLLGGLASLPADSGTDPTRIEVSEVLATNAWIWSDQARFNTFLSLHGDDEGGQETGFHRVQNDGGTTRQFGRNLVNTVLDGTYHIGFEVGADGPSAMGTATPLPSSQRCPPGSITNSVILPPRARVWIALSTPPAGTRAWPRIPRPLRSEAAWTPRIPSAGLSSRLCRPPG